MFRSAGWEIQMRPPFLASDEASYVAGIELNDLALAR
jgi:hypothetical protein